MYIHSLVKGLVVEVQVSDDQLCGPHRDHLVLVELIGFVVLVFPQLFSAKPRNQGGKVEFPRSETHQRDW